MFSIPNLLTLANLLSGCIALLMLIRLDISGGMLFFGLSLLFDVLDGLTARMMRQQSAIGKELDSLADMVSFGILPGLAYYLLLAPDHAQGVSLWTDIHLEALPALLVPACSALRLAKFNTDEHQTSNFSGLPTPAHAVFAMGLLYCMYEPSSLMHLAVQWPILIYACLVTSSILLIAPFPMLSLKAHNLKWQENKSRYFLVGGTLLLFTLLGLSSLPLIIIFYLLLSAVSLGFGPFSRKQ